MYMQNPKENLIETVEWLLAEALGQGNWGDTAQRVQITVRR